MEKYKYNGEWNLIFDGPKLGLRLYRRLWQVGFAVRFYTAVSGAKILTLHLPLADVDVVKWYQPPPQKGGRR